MNPPQAPQAPSKNSLKADAAHSIVRCPFCESTNTHKESDFGTTLAYAQFYCNECRTMFEWLKWEDGLEDQNLPKFVTK